MGTGPGSQQETFALGGKEPNVLVELLRSTRVAALPEARQLGRVFPRSETIPNLLQAARSLEPRSVLRVLTTDSAAFCM